MQYVRSVSSSVTKTWNSINPATLSGAIDVIVVELEDGSLACSPFHVRFGKFSLLRPYEKKVEFQVNDVKQDYAMKLGEGGEAFFVFETSEDIPESLQTSPLVSPTMSAEDLPAQAGPGLPSLQEPDFLDLAIGVSARPGPTPVTRPRSDPPVIAAGRRAHSDMGNMTPLSLSPGESIARPISGDWAGTSLPHNSLLDRSSSEEISPSVPRLRSSTLSDVGRLAEMASRPPQAPTDPREASKELGVAPSHSRSVSPPPIPMQEAVDRAKSLSKKLSSSNIPTRISETGDLMLDTTGYKSSEDDVLRAEVIARKILSEELEGNYDIGALIGADERGNLWIYSSEEAKEAAGQRACSRELAPAVALDSDAASDPGYQSDGERSEADAKGTPVRRESDPVPAGLVTPPQTPPDTTTGGDSTRNYAKTLRLTSEQLKALGLRAGANSMSFSVNRATCTAYMYLWKYEVPIVISDIDGTITKSDALGHVLNMIGRDWTHLGVAKLYTDIVANGYNILYLTSRSVGQADTTRAYLKGVVQDSHKLPPGPVIMSPDRTIAALRREIYLRKPEVFKMACLRDILNLFGKKHNPFYAGFGNRLTDALSYRSVNIPSTRIFTINTNAEVSLDLLTLNKYKSSYVTMREIVDHFFPPVGLLVSDGGEDFTDFNFWRDPPLQLDDFSASESGESDSDEDGDDRRSVRSEDEGSEGLEDEDLAASYLSRDSYDETAELASSIMEASTTDDERMTSSMVEQDGDADEAQPTEGPRGERDEHQRQKDAWSNVPSGNGGAGPENRPRSAIKSLASGVRQLAVDSARVVGDRISEQKTDPSVKLSITPVVEDTN
ncbi:MAG: hypothetical protein M1832_003835 [Thelocarpon impressellum]|nr:MAG: hypothetical protein M1832_003835 [Thelocarpon impressellum]